MKPVYIQHTRPDLLSLNPNLREFVNLNGWFFYKPKTRGGYDVTNVSKAVFTKNYLESDWVSRKDRNHPLNNQLHTINIESYPLDRIDDPRWQEWTERVREILHLMQATGRTVLTYGMDGDRSFLNYWNLYRLQFVLNRPDLAKEKMKIETERNRSIQKTHERFGDLIDIMSVAGYSPYWISDAGSWECEAYMYQMEQRCIGRLAAYVKHFPLM